MMRILATASLVFCLLIQTGCSPVFVVRSAYEEAKILLRRKDISRVIEQPKLDPTIRKKLELVLLSRSFAKEMGLNVGDSFTKYSSTGNKDALLWVISASKPDSFALHQWWFPVVGWIPYKGHFSKRAAEREKGELEGQGFEVAMYGSPAFSTLGWFNDPVLTTTLRAQYHSVVDTVIHECVHSTIWIDKNAMFNESLANFVGSEGARQFFGRYPNIISPELGATAASSALAGQLALSDTVTALYSELDEMYQSYAPTQVKLEYKKKIFEKHSARFKSQFPKATVLTRPNNAELIQLKLYTTALGDFQKLFKHSEEDWGQFFEAIEKIKTEAEEGKDPFLLLKRHG